MQAKKLFILSIILLATMISCGGRNNQPTGDILTINVSANFPERTMILQDFMDVEYIVLDDSDDFITQGIVRAVGNDVILVTNQLRDGNIFVFDRNTGEGLRVINRMGQGGQDYSGITSIVLDEENGEIFVQDARGRRRFVVYDLYGNYRRSFAYIDGFNWYDDIFNYDRNHLLVRRGAGGFHLEYTQISFSLICKQDGSVTREIEIAEEGEHRQLVVLASGGSGLANSSFNTIAPYNNGWMLMHTASDTIFNLSDGVLTPLITRTPSVHSMRTETFLFPIFFTDQYYFMQTIRREFNFNTGQGFPRTILMYDRQENAIFRAILYNDDFLNRGGIEIDARTRPISHNIAFFEVLQAYQLVDAYENGELSGRLKEIASTLNEESNPVIMLVKHRR